MHRFKELEVWKSSRVFCTSIYGATANFPDNERFGLVSQLRRASVSIASNIAEGASRRSNKDFYRFLEIAIGSAYEIETQLLIASDLNFLNQKDSEKLINELQSIIKMLSKLMSSLKR
ncbi:four helix bundle protein [Kordia algicida OT-1]|uniref:S23 ribosomal n=1 Tax=Kordia algicida OT-1 TaxID=391587 RepID=A9DV43_9FLAO|nr:four helix bundle protein [Kordia algicida]EDP96372.1 S23 ribosomal [Kordia algicida OT-1]